MEELQDVRSIQDLWRHEVSWEVPSVLQCVRWLRFHTMETVTSATKKTGARQRFRSMTKDHAIRYCSKLCNDRTFQLFEQSKYESQVAESNHAA